MLMPSRRDRATAPTTTAPDDTAALEVRSLTVSYRAAPVLWEVDARFPTGALSAIVGPNGAGKSTLLKAALGLVPADAGRVLVAGDDGASARDRVAYVPQRESVDWDFPITVREVVEMGRYRSVGWFRRVGRHDRRIAGECLDRVGMAAFGRRQIGQLSGGQRQRVFLARALAQQAPVLLMDEPFAGIDARTQADLLGLLGELRDAGGSVIVVHHDIAQVRAAFDWTLLLNVRALGCGPTAEVLTGDAVRAAYGAGAEPADEVVAWTG
ncbi:metal ABC transporter ATP-binding protein [Pseudonocardia bannensis]|uniref:Metal ABC transporter ATP-binding protein n=2 Tax=Pseudonocardia bannensis TaxID=630973 RepID=A0A848DPX5_9PSEU|nr:metal ABC transporter ATP-binding protein [Pseudonocardia bannensis]